jgi:hypothetical protein
LPALEEWTIERKIPENVLTAGNTYELKNTTVGHYVVYGEREYGINLVWAESSRRDIFFAHELGQPQGTPILYNEPIAIAVADGGYLKYQARDYGINLVWSAERVTEWELRGGTSGDQIPYANNQFSLYNRVASDYVVYCERSYGINLRWSGDCHRFDTPSQTAQVSVAYRIPLGGGGTRPSFGTVLFSGQRTGSGGQVVGGEGDTSFRRSDQWEAPPGSESGLATVTVAGLAPGTWRIEARTPLWVASCDVNLTAGINASVNFEERSTGCGRGFAFPSFAFPIRTDIGLRPLERVVGFAAARLESGADADDLEKGD